MFFGCLNYIDNSTSNFRLSSVDDKNADDKEVNAGIKEELEDSENQKETKRVEQASLEDGSASSEKSAVAAVQIKEVNSGIKDEKGDMMSSSTATEKAPNDVKVAPEAAPKPFRPFFIDESSKKTEFELKDKNKDKDGNTKSEVIFPVNDFSHF